jgi:hypothetical protein
MYATFIERTIEARQPKVSKPVETRKPKVETPIFGLPLAS